MSSEEKLSPEEKLLKIIQDSDGRTKAATPAKPAASATAPAAPAPAAHAPAAAKPMSAVEAAAPTPAPEKEPPAAPKLKVAATAGVKPVVAGAAPKPRAEAEAEKARVAATAPAAAPAAEPLAPAAAAAPLASSADVRRARSATLRFANAALSVAVALLAIWVALDLRGAVRKAEAVEVDLAAPVAPPLAEEPPAPALPPVAALLEQAAKRNVFQPFDFGTGTAPAVTNAPPLEFKLIGVSWGSDAAAGSQAIIREVKAQVTHFVKEGEPIGGSGVTVERIYRDRVVLRNQQQEMELK